LQIKTINYSTGSSRNKLSVRHDWFCVVNKCSMTGIL